MNQSDSYFFDYSNKVDIAYRNRYNWREICVEWKARIILIIIFLLPLRIMQYIYFKYLLFNDFMVFHPMNIC